MGVLGSYRERLAAAQQLAQKMREDPSRWPYREAAAVLSRFIPAKLVPVDATAASQTGWQDFLIDCEPASREEGTGWWQLRENVRRDTFRFMRSPERLRKALYANPERSNDDLQQALTSAILNEPRRRLAELTREELVALVTVRDWLGGILQGLPTEAEMRHALVIAETLAPMRRLAGGGRFAGRKNELMELGKYVGVKVTSDGILSRGWGFVRDTYWDLTSRPPLLITGPGGIGKSSLLARFILDYCENFESPDALPFVYLDLDRKELNPAKPLSLVAAAATQLSIEWPKLEKMFTSITLQIAPLIQANEGPDSSFEGARSVSASSFIIGQFGKALDAGSAKRPVLFAIDAFEEAQYQGFDVVEALGRLLADLQKAAPMLRIVLAGRANQEDQIALPTSELPLDLLSKADARELLRVNIDSPLTLDSGLLAEIAELVGRSPLTLRLAATIINEQGPQALFETDRRGRLLLKVKTGTVESMLYGRILAHIHDDETKQIAKPALVLRRLTPDIIQDVLGPALGISVNDSARAEEVFLDLSREIGLFVATSDGSLRHRLEVRAIMIQHLAEELPAATVRDIHDRAVSYYAAQQPDLLSRAEEIYHRLMRGDDPQTLDVLWLSAPEMKTYLQSAVEEVPPDARIWLSRKLGVTPDRELLAKAELSDWEKITAQAVQRRIAAGEANAALSLLSSRPDRGDRSPLFRLESEALRLLGRFDEARQVAGRGLEASGRAGDSSLQRELLMQRGLVEETAGNPKAALDQVEAALRVPGDKMEPVDKLRVTIAQIRLLRKLGPERDEERRSAIERATELLTPEVRDSLSQRSALLRETVAELGVARPEVLNQGLEVLGLDSLSKEATEGIADALIDWNFRERELGERVGLLDASPEGWRRFVFDLSGKELSSNLLNWRAEMTVDRGVDKAVVDFYRSGVESALIPQRADVK